MSLKGYRVSKITLWSLVVVAVCLLVIWVFKPKPPRPIPPVRPTPVVSPTFTNQPIMEGTMKLTSPEFSDKNFIPEKYTCDGENFSPPLVISGVLPGTQSLVLIVDDPDAPGGDWVHWLMWGIKPAAAEIPEGSVPIGATQGLNDFGEEGYGGPCPPSGTHRYQFTLYALNSTLEDQLSPLATKAEILEAIDGYVIDQTTLTGLYSKQ